MAISLFAKVRTRKRHEKKWKMTLRSFFYPIFAPKFLLFIFYSIFIMTHTDSTSKYPAHQLLSRPDLGLFILRVSLSLLMLLHGIAKFSGIDFIKGVVAGLGLPEFFAYGVFVGEVVAPLLILVGFRTRLAAAVFAFNMLVATLLVHSSQIFTLGDQGGWAIELVGLYFFGAVALIFTGAGRWAVSSNNVLD